MAGRTAAQPATAQPEPGDAEMTLEPDPVAPAAKPKALVARIARTKRSQAAVDLKTSDSDEQFVNKIIDDSADAEDGEITMSAMELPKSKAERAAAKKKLSAPVADVVPEVAKAPAPAKKKHMTRAEKRRAKLMAKLEQKKAKEMAAREARLRGQRARIDEEERERVSSARKDRRSKKHKGKFFKNGEGFIDDEDAAGGDDSGDEGAADDDDADDDASADDDDSGDDEDDDDSVVVVSSKKKPKPMAAPAKPAATKPAATKPAASKPAAKGKATHVKADWRGQAIDDEDPLKSQKKK